MPPRIDTTPVRERGGRTEDLERAPVDVHRWRPKTSWLSHNGPRLAKAGYGYGYEWHPAD